MLRTMELQDYDRLISTMDDWWDGRRVHDKLPRLFVEHFREMSLVIEEGDAIVGFLVGFASSSAPEEAYIHFVGVDPGHRRGGLARLMYEHFFAMARARGRTLVRCVTSPSNRASVAYHASMGFQIQDGDGAIDGVPVHLDHDGQGEHRVRFVRAIAPETGGSHT